MSRLRIFAETDGAKPIKTLTRHAEVARELAGAGHADAREILLDAAGNVGEHSLD